MRSLARAIGAMLVDAFSAAACILPRAAGPR
jgi:hypothetical protein